MNFEERKKAMLKLLKSQKGLNKYWNDGDANKIRDATKYMINTLEDIKCGKTVVIGSKRENQIKNTTNMVLDVVLNLGITDYMKDLAISYGIILKNWNDNTLNDETLKYEAKSIVRLIESNYSIRDLINIVDKLKRNNIENRHARLARHYLKTLEDDVDDS